MIELRENLGELITTVHNPECVVEIYFDATKREINEVKCLNYNRCKVYNYKLEDYSETIKQYNLELPLELV